MRSLKRLSRDRYYWQYSSKTTLPYWRYTGNNIVGIWSTVDNIDLVETKIIFIVVGR